ncbi:MAG: KpsF/GutQ family sugar-phosphate isomerase [Candidatus Omnitrophica bacterium]|nr:KpsF/GutQ family sugar-phosphate isomerase [Candidatus Omnitrophota bacterium]
MCVKRAREVLRIEAEAIKGLTPRLNEDFNKAVRTIYECKGMVVLTGMGKAGIIAQKISATLASTGTPSLFLHSAEAIHGDLGRVRKEDVVVALSYSGETQEVKQLLPILKKIGSTLISITGGPRSTLARYSDVVLDVSVKREACPLGLAPTASTTAMLAMGDALSVCVQEKKGFREEDFALYHPGGSLGKRLLLKVADIMRKGRDNPVVKESEKVSRVLYKITQARAGAASIVGKDGKLSGIFTDGDLRRHLESDIDIANCHISEVMTRRPATITKERLAVEALKILKDKKIDELPVVDEKMRPVGMLDVQDLLKAGLV